MLENLNSYLDDPVDGNKQDDEVEIDLLEIFYVLKSKFLILLTVGLLVGCLCGVFTKFAMTPVYTSTSSILVLSKETTLTSLADIQPMFITKHMYKFYKVIVIIQRFSCSHNNNIGYSFACHLLDLINLS